MIVKGCGRDRATDRNDAKSGSESPFDENAILLDSANTDEQEENGKGKRNSEKLAKLQRPEQAMGASEAPIFLVTSHTTERDNGLKGGSIDYEENFVLERIRLEVQAAIPMTFRKDHMASQFEVEWTPKDFMHRQFGNSRVESIGSVVVIIGTSLNAEALTCKQYLQKHWPATCATLLRFLDDKVVGIHEFGDDFNTSTYSNPASKNSFMVRWNYGCCHTDHQ